MVNKVESYKGLYAMHKYWGKKPFGQISSFIKRYSNEGETVLDSFCGSGVTIIEAARCNRKAVGIDLNPFATFLTKASLTYVDKKVLLEEYQHIENELKDLINSLYVDDSGHLVTHVIWKNGEPIEVWYLEGKKKTIRNGTRDDARKATYPEIQPSWYPESIMFENSRINVGKNEKVSDLFTPRALVGLSKILEKIEEIQDESIRNIFKIAFSGTLSQSSNLVFVIRNRKVNGAVSSKAEVGSWVVGYWVPEEHFEINVWKCFSNRFKRIISGVDDIDSFFSKSKLLHKNGSHFENDIKVFNTSATNLPIEDGSIDYVFTDPPHANRILYLEMSLMWNAWLKLDKNIAWNDEVVISEAKDRDKDLDDYSKLLSDSFSEINRVLKPNHYFSMAFNCLDDDTWLSILNLYSKYGFKLEKVSSLEYSAASVVQDNRKNALKTDFVLTCRKTKYEKLKKIVFNENLSSLKQDIASLRQANPLIEFYEVVNALYEKSIPEGSIYRISTIAQLFSQDSSQESSK